VNAIQQKSCERVLEQANLAENHVLSVQPRRLARANEKLRPVAVGPRVRHGEGAHAVVQNVEVFVGKLGAVDRHAAGAVAAREVTALAHEALAYTIQIQV